MTPEDAVLATQAAVHDIPSAFMLHGSTYAKGAELGFEGIDFYTCGRGGPLGDVDADVVSASFVFFSPTYIREGWERGASAMSRAEASAAFLDCGYAFARRKLGEAGGGTASDADLVELGDLLARIVDAADHAGAPLFAALRAVPAPGPDDPAARVMHLLDALREHRAALHGAAVLASGISPLQALSHKTPIMVGIFGWPEAADTSDPAIAERWAEAEAATNRLVTPAFAALDATELDRLAELTATLRPA